MSDGDYSDYHLIAICSTKERAADVVKFYGGEVEEWQCDNHMETIGLLRQGYKAYRLWIRFDGTISTGPEEIPGPPDDLDEDEERLDFSATLSVRCVARDAAHAIKIAAEHRQAWLRDPDRRVKWETAQRTYQVQQGIYEERKSLGHAKAGVNSILRSVFRFIQTRPESDWWIRPPEIEAIAQEIVLAKTRENVEEIRKRLLAMPCGYNDSRFNVCLLRRAHDGKHALIQITSEGGE